MNEKHTQCLFIKLKSKNTHNVIRLVTLNNVDLYDIYRIRKAVEQKVTLKWNKIQRGNG